jgi:hypothetical protein
MAMGYCIALSCRGDALRAGLLKPGLLPDAVNGADGQILLRVWHWYRSRLVWMIEDVMTALDAVEIPAVRLQRLDQVSALHPLLPSLNDNLNITLGLCFVNKTEGARGVGKLAHSSCRQLLDHLFDPVGAGLEVGIDLLQRPRRGELVKVPVEG